MWKWLLITLLMGANPVLAVDDAASELVYRSNLGRADDVQLLLSQHVSPDTKDEKGKPILALAASRHDVEGVSVVRVLLEGGAQINLPDSKGQTALFHAAKQGNVPIVQLLLDHNADMSILDADGNTARMVAHLSGQKDVVEAMDAFVKEQVEAQGKAKEEAARQALLAKEKELLTGEKQLLTQALEAEREKVRQATEPPAAQSLSEMAREMAKKTAFETCAFQYWAFCRDVKKSTSLSADALEAEILQHKTASESLAGKLVLEQKVPVELVNTINSSAQQRIYNTLNQMPSNTYRHQEGVGKPEDMQQRCNSIAEHWDIPPPGIKQAVRNLPPPTPAPAKTPAPGKR